LVPQLDPSLGSERLRATELGLDWRAATHLRLAASLYRNDAGQPSDAVASGLSQGLLRFQNLGRANGDGIELGSEYAADAGWQLRASWAASRARDETDSAATQAPRTLAKLQAAAQLPWRGARAGVEWWLVGAQGQAQASEPLLNATLDWSPTGTPWTLAAGAYNLTGRTLADNGSADPLQAALLRDGRRLQLQLARAF
jgi:TonB dependent receptor